MNFLMGAAAGAAGAVAMADAYPGESRSETVSGAACVCFFLFFMHNAIWSQSRYLYTLAPERVIKK